MPGGARVGVHGGRGHLQGHLPLGLHLLPPLHLDAARLDHREQRRASVLRGRAQVDPVDVRDEQGPPPAPGASESGTSQVIRRALLPAREAELREGPRLSVLGPTSSSKRLHAPQKLLNCTMAIVSALSSGLLTPASA